MDTRARVGRFLEGERCQAERTRLCTAQVRLSNTYSLLPTNKLAGSLSAYSKNPTTPSSWLSLPTTLANMSSTMKEDASTFPIIISNNAASDDAKRPVAELGGKARVMELITHPNSDVRYRALLSVQQLVSQPWITA